VLSVVTTPLRAEVPAAGGAIDVEIPASARPAR
jgi:hypothetical protein